MPAAATSSVTQNEEDYFYAPQESSPFASFNDDHTQLITHALQEDSINIFIQPIVSFEKRKKHFFECYSSLTLKDGKSYTAAEFIKFVEEINLINIIDNTVIFHIIKMIRNAIKKKTYTRFFCNISPQTLLDKTFFNSLVRFLSNKPELARCIVFEFSAENYKDNLAKIRSNIRKLKFEGCLFSIDQIENLDINFLELQDLHCDFLKINASFLLKILKQKKGVSKIERFKETCKKYDISIIVSHIENEDMVKTLSPFKFEYAQGFLFGKLTPLQNSKTIVSRTIEIIATGEPCCPKELSDVHSYLTSKDLAAHVTQDFFGKDPLYVCGPIQRFSNLKTALQSDQSDFLWCLRGGFGTSLLLPQLFRLSPPKKRKNLIGFSDVTELHLFLTQQWGWKTIYGPNLTTFINRTKMPTVETIMEKIVNCKHVDIQTPILPLNVPAHLQVPCTGKMIGGNLTLIQRSLGTPWQMLTKDKIIFFEDSNKSPLLIAENLYQLKHAGLFQDAKALIFGSFLHADPQKDHNEIVKSILLEFSKTLIIPAFFGFPVGYIKDNHPVQLEEEATLKPVGKKILYNQTIAI